MSIALTLLLPAALLAPFLVTGAFAARAQRAGMLRLHADQFRFAAPMAEPLFSDQDERR